MSGGIGFEILLDALLPRGGHAIVISAVYFDESYAEGSKDRILCVAGYVFRKHKATSFSRLWSEYLARKEVPYFHMSECAHGKGVFEGKDCDGIARELIRRTKNATEMGIAVAMRESDFDELLGVREGMRSAYSFLVAMALHHITSWRLRNNITGPTAVFAESGNAYQADADYWVKWLLQNPSVASGLGFSGNFGFLAKEEPGLHPADMLAWQWRTEASRIGQPDRIKTRRDFIALRRPQDVLILYPRHRIERLAATLANGERERAELFRQLAEQGVDVGSFKAPPMKAAKTRKRATRAD